MRNRFLFLLLPALSCGEAGECEVIEEGEDRVVVGFWETEDCSGDPIAVNSFPVEPEAACYCWPGHSGENSAEGFTCGDDGDFTYIQYGSLECGLGDTTPTSKTVYTTRCVQDTPPTLYTQILDYAACE